MAQTSVKLGDTRMHTSVWKEEDAALAGPYIGIKALKR